MNNARNGMLPDLEVFGRVGVVGLDQSFEDSVATTVDEGRGEWEVGVQVSIPLGPGREVALKGMLEEDLYVKESQLELVEARIREQWQTQQRQYTRQREAFEKVSGNLQGWPESRKKLKAREDPPVQWCKQTAQMVETHSRKLQLLADFKSAEARVLSTENRLFETLLIQTASQS